MNHQTIATNMANNIMASIEAKALEQQRWHDAVRLQLGCPSGRPLPQDPMFDHLLDQLGSPTRPRIELDMTMVPANKRAMILLAVHGILNS